MLKDKRKRIRLILFLLALVTAVGSFTYGVIRLGHKESGYQQIDPEDTHGDVLYRSGLTLLYWAEGSSAEIRALTTDVRRVYSDSLYRNFTMLDPRQTYDGLPGLASVSLHPGETAEIPPSLAAVLRDALEKTKADAGYSLFAGALYDEWQTLLYLEDPSGADPASSADQAERLRRLSEWTRPGIAPELEIREADGKATACLRLPAGLAVTLAEMEITAPVLDLNLLHDAYLMDLVAADLRSAGYREGVLFSRSGYSLMLREGDSLQVFLTDGDPEPALTADGPAASARFAAGDRLPDGYGAYTIGSLKRHFWFDARTGGFRDIVDRAVLTGPPQAAELAWQLIRLNCAEDPDAVPLPEGVRCVWTRQSHN